MANSPKDEKYIVFRRGIDPGALGEQIYDAVVIRKQDVFAPPALDAYANAITCVIEALKTAETDLGIVDGMGEKIRTLRRIADYFRRQAEDAYMMQRKLPD